jgi:hypothetical protein
MLKFLGKIRRSIREKCAMLDNLYRQLDTAHPDDREDVIAAIASCKQAWAL